ncbi:MAG: hypothetical protein ABDH21_04450 [bacterium]
MGFEQIKFIMIYYLACILTFTIVTILGYFIAIQKYTEGPKWILIPITAIIGIIAAYFIEPIYRDKLQSKYSDSINQIIFKSSIRIENFEIQKYIPNKSDFFKSFLEKQKISHYEYSVNENNSLIIKYTKQREKYTILLSEIKIIEVRPVIGAYRTPHRYGRNQEQYTRELLFSGLCIGIPSKILNKERMYPHLYFRAYEKPDYSVILSYYPSQESPFKFSLFEKINNQIVQQKLQEIISVIKRYLL